MKCPAKGKLRQSADGEMSASERRLISSHIDVCPECRDLWHGLQEDSSLIREKMKLLDPAVIPARPFRLSNAEPTRARRHSAFSTMWRSSVRIPALVLFVSGIVFFGLISGLIIQGRRLARQESESFDRAPRETIFISAASSFQAYGLDIDLKNYEPMDHPNVIFLQKESR